MDILYFPTRLTEVPTVNTGKTVEVDGAIIPQESYSEMTHNISRVLCIIFETRPDFIGLCAHQAAQKAGVSLDEYIEHVNVFRLYRKPSSPQMSLDELYAKYSAKNGDRQQFDTVTESDDFMGFLIEHPEAFLTIEIFSKTIVKAIDLIVEELKSRHLDRNI
jgi:hypothetical protein